MAAAGNCRGGFYSQTHAFDRESDLAVVLVLPATRRARGTALLTIILLAALGFLYARGFAHNQPVSRSLAALLDPLPFLWAS